MDDIDAYLQQNREAFEDQLCELLAIPSVSADTKFHGEVRRAAEWVAWQFHSLPSARMRTISSRSGSPTVRMIVARSSASADGWGIFSRVVAGGVAEAVAA